MLHIVARDKNNRFYDLYFSSVNEAKHYNPSFIEFRVVGIKQLQR